MEKKLVKLPHRQTNDHRHKYRCGAKKKEKKQRKKKREGKRETKDREK